MTQMQEKYTSYLSKIQNILENVDFSQEDSETLKQQIEKTELIVPVVGGFSAGKSTMINQFLGENILSVDLTPETALATELRYSQENYFEAINKNGEAIKYNLSQTEEIKEKAEQYQYLKLYLNNQRLREIQPLVLVDMPGFDAPIEHHNQAILSYLSKGVYFIMLISAEDGTIQKSILREISNIMEFSKGFSFCLSKTNLRSQSDTSNIQNEIKKQLKDYFNYEGDVALLHKESGDDFKNLLLNINPEDLIQKIFIDDLKLQNRQIQSQINTQISSLKMNAQEAKEAIEALNESLEKISNDKDKKLQEIEQKYTLQNVENIVSKVHLELLQQKDTFTSLMLNNKDAFANEINSTIRQVLLAEIQNKITSINQKIIEDIKIDLKGLDNINLDTQWIDILAEKMKGLFNAIPIPSSEEKNKNASHLSQKLSTVATTTIAQTTIKFLPRIGAIPATILNPVLGLVVALLPELINLFTKNIKENMMKEKALEHYEHSILPSIKTNIRNSLKEIFSQYAQESMTVIHQEFEIQIKQKQEEINQSQQERQKQQDEIEQKIEWLVAKRNEIQTLAEQYLY